MSPVGSMPPHIRSHPVPEPILGGVGLGLFFSEVLFCIFNHFRGVNHRWHGATPLAGYEGERRGLSLAEPSVSRYWRGVEGGTVLNHNSLSLQKIYVMILQKQN